MIRYRLITAPGKVTVDGQPYYYYWDDNPCPARGLPRGVLVTAIMPHHHLADGRTPEEAKAALRAMGLDENATF